MTEPHTAHIALRSEAMVSPRALTSLAELLQSYIEDNLVKTVIPETEGSDEAARAINSKSTRRRRSRGSTRPKGT